MPQPDPQASVREEKKRHRELFQTLVSDANEAAGIVEQLTRWGPGAGFDWVLACLPGATEPDLTVFLNLCLERGQRVALARVEAKAMTFVHVSSLDGPWESHRWGLSQPFEGPCWEPSENRSSLVLVPGLAFAPGGARLGRGGGFFDRFLGQNAPSVVSLGYAFSGQAVSWLPTEPHDHLLDGLILGADSAILKAGVHLWH